RTPRGRPGGRGGGARHRHPHRGRPGRAGPPPRRLRRLTTEGNTMTTTSFGPGPRIIGDFTSSPFEPVLPPVTPLDDVHVTDPNLYIQGDPHGTWKLLREQAPVFWHEKGTLGTEFKGFWVGSRFADFIAVT